MILRSIFASNFHRSASLGKLERVGLQVKYNQLNSLHVRAHKIVYLTIFFDWEVQKITG